MMVRGLLAHLTACRCLIPGIKGIWMLQAGSCFCNCLGKQEAVPHHSWFLRARIRPLQRLLMPAQGTGSLPFLKARELLHEKAPIVNPSIRLPSILQHKKTSVPFPSTDWAAAGKASAWRELGTAAAAGPGAAFTCWGGSASCALIHHREPGCREFLAWPKGHRQLCYERACGRRWWKKGFLCAEKGWGWCLPGVDVQLTSHALDFLLSRGQPKLWSFGLNPQR